MPVADVQYANTTGEIDQAVAIRIPDLGIARVIGEQLIGTGCAGCDILFLQGLQFFIIHQMISFLAFPSLFPSRDGLIIAGIR